MKASASRTRIGLVLACVALVACESELCDPVVVMNPDVDEVMIDAGIRDVDFEELRLYPERYAERRVRARGWVELGPAHFLVEGVAVELTRDQEEWLSREHNGHLRSYADLVGRMTITDAGHRSIRAVTEITQADRPSRRDH